MRDQPLRAACEDPIPRIVAYFAYLKERDERVDLEVFAARFPAAWRAEVRLRCREAADLQALLRRRAAR